MFNQSVFNQLANIGVLRKLIVGMFCFSLFQGVVSANIVTSQYILCARPVAAFGDELKTYFDAIKSDPAMKPVLIKNFLERCELTKYFPKRGTEAQLTLALKKAVTAAGAAAKAIAVIGIVRGQQNNEVDFIRIGSQHLLNLTKIFFQKAQIHNRYLINPADSPYRITLRNHSFKHLSSPNTLEIVRKQAQINLRARAHWNIVLLRKNNQYLEVVLELPL